MQIGLLQAGYLPEEFQQDFGDYPAVYNKLMAPEGITFKAYPVIDSVFPDSVHAEVGWLISGSRHGAYEDHPWIPPLEDFIREAHAQRVPMVGICFGHQIIAQALGGTVEKFAGGWAVGRHVYDWNGRDVALNVWHQDQVTKAPDGATVFATSPFCRNAAMMVGDDVLTMQPHPEFDRGATESLLDGRGPGIVPDQLLAQAKDALDQPIHDAQIAAQIGAFFKERIGHDRVA
ncbi:MAG: type 1 glutamine amidotransferase [Pseudomonadota bacterium]